MFTKRLLTDQEMKDITTCKMYIPGDYINWHTQKWTTNPHAKTNFTSIQLKQLENIKHEDICRPTKNWVSLFTFSTFQPMFQEKVIHFNKNQWQHNKLFCATMKGQQTVLPDSQSMQEFKNVLDTIFQKSAAIKERCLNTKTS